MSEPKQITLTVFHEFKASHSLPGFEVPHFHLWKVAAAFSAPLPLKDDRLIDLVFLQSCLEEMTKPLQGKDFNQRFTWSPTSENLALWFWKEVTEKIKTHSLHSITITLCDLEGRPSGSARVNA